MLEKLWLSEPLAIHRRVVFDLIDSSNHFAAKNPTVTGVKARLSQQGVDYAASANDIVATSAANHPGRHYLELTPSELLALGVGRCGLFVQPTGCDPCPIDFDVVAYDPKADGATAATIATATLAAATSAPIAADLKKVNSTALGAHAGTTLDPFGP